MRRNYLDYPVEFTLDAFGASSVLADMIEAFGKNGKAPRILLIADMNVVEHTANLGTKIGRYIKEHKLELATSPVVISGGEKIKADNLQSVIKIIASTISAGIGSNDCILALGGGAILDVAGYAASQLMGGVRLIRMPTTPSSMMGGAFANYAAVDSLRIKDALQVPSVPAAVLIDPTFANSVLDGVWRGGISEAISYATLNDKVLLKTIKSLAKDYETRKLDALSEIIKKTVVSRAKHKSPRKMGEWIASRLETMSGYKLPRGYALAIAIEIEINYALERGEMTAKDVKLVHDTLKETGALDGLKFSEYLLSRTKELVDGFALWQQMANSECEKSVDLAIYEKVIRGLLPIHKSA